MFSCAQPQENLYHLSIYLPRMEQDEIDFFNLLKKLETQSNFAFSIEVKGEKAFSLEAKKKLAIWFKENKTHLEKTCKGFAKISYKKHDHDKQEALQKAFPCPYQVFKNRLAATEWLLQLTSR